MTWVWVGALVIGTVVAEIVHRTLGGPRVRTHAARVIQLLGEFRSATDDDQRQALLLRSGGLTLLFSLQLLMLMFVLLALVYALPWALGWGTTFQLMYGAALSLVATAWIVWRRSRRKSGDGQAPDVRI